MAEAEGRVVNLKGVAHAKGSAAQRKAETQIGNVHLSPEGIAWSILGVSPERRKQIGVTTDETEMHKRLVAYIRDMISLIKGLRAENEKLKKDQTWQTYTACMDHAKGRIAKLEVLLEKMSSAVAGNNALEAITLVQEWQALKEVT